MGRLKESRQPSADRDDNAASTSSAISLQDQDFANEVPPAYTDDPEPVKSHNHGDHDTETQRKSVGGRAPRRFIEDGNPEDEHDPFRKHRQRQGLLDGVRWKISENEDAKGSTTTYISETLSSDPAVCQAFIETRIHVPIQPFVRLVGTHTETRRRDKKDETTRVTDFDVSVSLEALLAKDWTRTRIVENSQKAYRGGIRKQLDPRVKAHPEAAATTPSLQEWCHRFCASSASAKSFTVSRTVTELQREILTKGMNEAVRGTNYRGDIAITYPERNRATIVMSDHWINRYRHNKLIWWICVILQLWIFTWPLLIFMTKRWEVLTVEWPCRIYVEPDGSWPMAQEFYPGGRTYEGHETSNPLERVAYMTEQDWARQWRLAVQLAAESKKRGTLSDGDWRIAQEVEERFRQRAAGRSAAGQDNGILAAATGLLSGVQGFMAQSQRASGWGGNCTY